MEESFSREEIEALGLSVEEYEEILRILERRPTLCELGIFSVMWSEHCSYKHTRPLLRRLPADSPRILVRAGEENAGVVDIGDGLAVAFKIESHNHPSAVEPFQGAATGVGGILRDIFTMGARPVCLGNSLRFGPLDSPRTRRLFSQVVAGIGHYGNCFGTPTVAGEVAFDPAYRGNPLVNVFALGAMRSGQIARGGAHGPGNPVFYVGPPTGRDGLAGAAFASRDLTEESSAGQRSAVQVGDPFMEKLLLEACLELLDSGAVAGIQDMGAAGLTCSTCETAARAGTGIEIDLDRVPRRSPGMTPYELLLSESQERMLVIVHQDRQEEVERIFGRWNLPWARIGTVTDTGQMVVRHQGEVVADLPASRLADQAPVRRPSSREPSRMSRNRQTVLGDLGLEGGDPRSALPDLLAWPTIASKNWVWSQYDHTVQNACVLAPGSDAAVIRIKPDSLPRRGREEDSFEEKYLAVSLDGNGRYAHLDPRAGGMQCVAEAARNLACSGAAPLGLTDNLNFGSPEDPEIFWEIEGAVAGIAEACRFLGVPVTGGNVSLYNQTPSGAIHPTPVVAMVGEVPDRDSITRQWFAREGDRIYLLGRPVEPSDPLQGLGGSALQGMASGLCKGLPPPVILEREKALADALRGWIHSGIVHSAHDCSEGGLAVALAECCLGRPQGAVGASVELPSLEGVGSMAMLFGESQGRILASIHRKQAPRLEGQARILEIPVLDLGETGGDRLRIRHLGTELQWDLEELRRAWWRSLEERMQEG